MLQYEKDTPDVYKKLQEIPRTGWVMRGVANPETVYDHTLALVQLAGTLQTDLNLTDTELDELQRILEIHDWAEALVGDEYIPNENPEAYQAKKMVKAQKEKDALEQLVENHPAATEITAYFHRYETGADPIATLAKELDKYQALELALKYEETQKIPLFVEFYEHYKRDWPFSHPVILDRIEQLRERHTRQLT